MTIRSTIGLPCPPERTVRRPDVRLVPGSTRRFAALRRAAPGPGVRNDWFRCRLLPDRSTWLSWRDLFDFLVSADGRTIRYQPRARASREAFTTYLLGQVLSFSLVARGEEPLHATAVELDGRVIAFLGDCGYGKSTLGAAFLAHGHRLVTDDVLALQPAGAGYAVHPGPPRIKLFPAVARRLLGATTGARLNDGTSKMILPLRNGQAARRALPLGALYVLSGRPPRARRVRIEPLQAGEALLAVIANSFNTIVEDRTRLANQFALASRLVGRVPIRRLVYPRRLAALPAVRRAILRDAGG